MHRANRDPKTGKEDPIHVAGGEEKGAPTTPTGHRPVAEVDRLGRRGRRDTSGDLAAPHGGARRREGKTPASGKHLRSGQIPAICPSTPTQNLLLSMMEPFSGPNTDQIAGNSESEMLPPVSLRFSLFWFDFAKTNHGFEFLGPRNPKIEWTPDPTPAKGR